MQKSLHLLMLNLVQKIVTAAQPKHLMLNNSNEHIMAGTFSCCYIRSCLEGGGVSLIFCCTMQLIFFLFPGFKLSCFSCETKPSERSGMWWGIFLKAENSKQQKQTFSLGREGYFKKWGLIARDQGKKSYFNQVRSRWDRTNSDLEKDTEW